jgi:hypothetical protein
LPTLALALQCLQIPFCLLYFNLCIGELIIAQLKALPQIGNPLAIKGVKDQPHRSADNYGHYREGCPIFRDDEPVALQSIEYCVGSHGICRLALMPKADAQLAGLLPQGAFGSFHLLCDLGDWRPCLRMPAQLCEQRLSPTHTPHYSLCHVQTPMRRDSKSH